MKKLIGLTLAVFMVMTGFLAAQDYSDLRSAIEKLIKGSVAFADSVSSSKTADEVVAAVNTFGEYMTAIGPELKAMQKKYPELKNKDAFPASLADLKVKMDELETKMAGTQTKFMEFQSDPKVMEALMKMGATMKAALGEEEKQPEKKAETTETK